MSVTHYIFALVVQGAIPYGA